jgi:hypothetical protein
VETGPHPLAERVVARLLPQPCREHVLGDLYERNATTGRYVRDAMRSVPFAVWGQVRRTTSPGLACLQGGAVYGGFLSAYGRVAPGVLQTTDGVLGTLTPALTAVVVLALRDAWTGHPQRISIRALVDAPLCVAAACAAHVALQACRAHSLVDSTVTMVAGVVSLLLLSPVRVPDAQANTPIMSVQSGGSGMQVPRSDGSFHRGSGLWLLALVPLGAAVGLGASYFSPSVYRAAVSVLVVLPSEVPPHVMPTDLRPHLAERLNVVSRQVLNNTRLERIIRDFNLYERERQVAEDAIPRMRQDISLNIVASGERGFWFTVAYRAADPKVAMRVAERFASLFVQENLEDAERSFGQANLALQSRLEETGNRLAGVSAELDQARRGAAGSRPVAVLDVEHQVIRDRYRSLFESAQVSRTGQDMERSSIGEQFRILEPARLPEHPIEPVPLFWSGLGAAAGLILASVTRLIPWWPRPPRAQPDATALPV